MEILVKTIAEKTDYCISKMYINGQYFCDVLEDSVRDLSKCKKIAGRTAIPAGRYRVTLDIVSQKFGTKYFYQQNADGGRLPRLLGVPQFSGILIHCGVNHNNTEGCLLVGENKQVGKLLNSPAVFKELYKVLQKERNNLWITIKRKSY